MYIMSFIVFDRIKGRHERMKQSKAKHKKFRKWRYKILYQLFRVKHVPVGLV